MKKTGILLVGHGSRKEYNKILIQKTAELMAASSPDYLVRYGFMEMSEPSIPDTLNTFKTEEIDALVVVPLFLARGVHTDEDIPGILGLKDGEKKGSFVTDNGTVSLVYADPIGPNPLLAELMLSNAKTALNLIDK